MKIKLILLSFLLLIANTAFAATTWYVRNDGGTSTQCTGTTDAPYPGSGSGQACGFVSPIYALGFYQYQSSASGGFGGVMSSGDSLIIDNINHSGGGQAQYRIGVGGVAFSCGPGANYDCALREPPSGADTTHPTRILGKGYASCSGTDPSTKAQLWGAEREPNLLRAFNKSNIDIECLDITDHANCTESGPTNACSRTGTNDGLWASNGLYFNYDTNMTLKNLDIHGLANRGVFLLHPAGTWTWSYVNIIAPGQAGVDTDDPGTSDDSWTATINMDHSKFDWAGCQEIWPITSALDSSGNIRAASCSSQGQPSGVYSDGWGQGDATMGTMNISDTTFSWNTQDGFDSLHGQGTGTVIMTRVRAEGNSGMAVKTNSHLVKIENSVLIGNCGYFDTGGNNPLVYSPSTYDNVCRGPGGEPVDFAISGTSQVFVYNSTLISNADVVVAAGSGTSNCTSSTLIQVRNSILIGGNDILGGDTTGGYFLDAQGGNCTSFPNLFDEDYNQWWHTKEGAAGPVSGKSYGAHSRYADPLLSGESVLKMTTSPYYQGTNGLAQVNLSASSPSRFSVTGANSADETLTFSSFGTNDFYNNARSTNWDGGALTYGSGPSAPICTANGVFCSIAGDCCSGFCVSNACSATPMCINNGNSCSADTDCCSGSCCSGFCATSCGGGGGGGTPTAGIAGGTTGKVSTTGKCVLF